MKLRFVAIKTNVGEIQVDIANIITWEYCEASERLILTIRLTDFKAQTLSVCVTVKHYREFVHNIDMTYTYINEKINVK